MNKKDNLKIQLRAVPYASYSKVLQYRFDPDQDLTYEEEPSNFVQRILKKLGANFKKRFDTGWHDIRKFAAPLTMDLYDFYDNFNWGPVWCDNQSTLEHYKRMFKTYKDLQDYLDEVNTKGYKEWKAAREAYLAKMKPLY